MDDLGLPFCVGGFLEEEEGILGVLGPVPAPFWSMLEELRLGVCLLLVLD